MHHRHPHGCGHGHRFMRRGPRMEDGLEGRRGHGGGGRHALGRFFAHGDLRLVILRLIAEKPRHGYDIIKAIEESVGGAYSPSPGVIYPTLTLLEELGYVTATPEGSKKLYEATEEGRAFLNANRATLEALVSRMAEASGGRTGRSLPIVRAMENLKTALRLRMTRGPITEEQTDAIAAAIDQAAAKVEKL